MTVARVGRLVLIFFIGLAGSLAVSAAMLASSRAEPEVEGGAYRSARLSTLADAEARAGFSTGVPSYIPDGFELRGAFASSVDDHGPSRITQMWGDPDSPSGASFTLLSAINLQGVSDGSATSVGGRPGRIVRDPATPARPFEIFAISWRDGELGHVIVAPLTGGMTEATLTRIAASLR